MQKTLIIVLLVAVVALSGVVVYQKLTPAETTPIVVNPPIVNQPAVNQPAVNQPSANTSCLKEGEIYGTGYAKDCCSGLNKIPNVFKTGTECSVSNGETAICTYCGNGVCGKGENQCNCPADCK